MQHLERDTRTRLHTVEREVAVERGITRELVEALHVRLDNFERDMLKEIRTLVARGANGHG